MRCAWGRPCAGLQPAVLRPWPDVRASVCRVADLSICQLPLQLPTVSLQPPVLSRRQRVSRRAHDEGQAGLVCVGHSRLSRSLQMHARGPRAGTGKKRSLKHRAAHAAVPESARLADSPLLRCFQLLKACRYGLVRVAQGR